MKIKEYIFKNRKGVAKVMRKQYMYPHSHAFLNACKMRLNVCKFEIFSSFIPLEFRLKQKFISANFKVTRRLN